MIDSRYVRRYVTEKRIRSRKKSTYNLLFRESQPALSSDARTQYSRNKWLQIVQTLSCSGNQILTRTSSVSTEVIVVNDVVKITNKGKLMQTASFVSDFQSTLIVPIYTYLMLFRPKTAIETRLTSVSFSELVSATIKW